MAEVVATVDVDADVARTWSALTDWDAHGAWMLGTTAHATGSGVGSRLEARTAFGPIGFTDLMEVMHWDPPHRAQVRHLGGLVRGVGVFEVEALPGGRSRVTWSEFLDLPLGLVGQVGFLLVRPLAVAGLRRSLQRFARWAPTR